MSDQSSPEEKQLRGTSVRMVPVIENTVTTLALMGESQVLTVRHDNASYQLRITSKNKLILTK
tara:strand:- start:320 stop:508 length:189 start_codon:yes stop_codon:yes gene_type:complete